MATAIPLERFTVTTRTPADTSKFRLFDNPASSDRSHTRFSLLLFISHTSVVC
eukprot:m.51926 g.51926  ORF g.51926 m.51926 type:complete len:53 (-) comp11748_c0_seq1:92-250(-)